jgi:hypothetical protein
LIVDEITLLRSEINDLFVKMRDYMVHTDKSDDAFMRQLCDDLYIANMSLNTFNGHMLTLSRFTSQGRQQTNISTPRRQDAEVYDYPSTPRRSNLTRQNTRSVYPLSQSEELEFPQMDENDLAQEIDSYEMSQSTTSCYVSPTVFNTMTQIQTQTIN